MNTPTKNLGTLRTIHTIQTIDHKRALTIAEFELARRGLALAKPQLTIA
jgi:hypothetical protein